MSLSTASVDAGVIATIAQLYSILFSTLFSTYRKQLSLFDVNYALTVTSSPFTIYLVHSSIRDLLGFETDLFKRIVSNRRLIHHLGALLLPIWFGLRLTLRLSSKAFTDSELCGNPTFGDFLADFSLALECPVTTFRIAPMVFTAVISLTSLVVWVLGMSQTQVEHRCVSIVAGA